MKLFSTNSQPNGAVSISLQWMFQHLLHMVTQDEPKINRDVINLLLAWLPVIDKISIHLDEDNFIYDIANDWITITFINNHDCITLYDSALTECMYSLLKERLGLE